MNLRVNEIFQSIQGEGYWTGLPCNFIRLSGCNLNCSWCDTEHKSFKEMNILQIIELLDKKYAHVIITGGEPTIHENLDDLIYMLKLKGFYIHIESNGTNRISNNIDWITVSPKYEAISEIKGNRIDELKLVADNNIEKMVKIYNRYNVKHKYIMPLEDEQGSFNWQKTYKLVMKYPEWKITSRLHSIMKVR